MIIKYSRNVSFNEIAITVLVKIITGSINIICKRAFDHKTAEVETGCDLINQKLLPSSDIDGAVMHVVALAKQKISAMMPARSAFGIWVIPNIAESPSVPVIAIKIPIANINTTPIIVLIRYAGVVA